MSVGAGIEFMTRWKTKKKCAQQGLTRSRKGLTRSRRSNDPNKRKHNRERDNNITLNLISSGRIAPN